MWKIKLQLGQKLFFFSDPHYSHKNICRGVTNWRTADGIIPMQSTRDFKTIDHMNSTIVNNINLVVGQDDILICLGDWSFGGFESIKEFRDRIICKNVSLIYGNHDHHIQNNREGIQEIFSQTSQYQMLTVEYEGNRNIPNEKIEFVLMHYPLVSWHDMNKGRIHLFGHTHLPTNRKIMKGRSMDVGMDGNNLMPYELLEILKLTMPRPIHTNIIASDYHMDTAN